MVAISKYTNPSRAPKTGKAHGGRVHAPNKGGRLDDFTPLKGKQGHQTSFNPERLTNITPKYTPGKFSNVTPGIKPETYLGKAAPSGREQDWEQAKIFGTGELRNTPSLIDTIKSAFGFGPKRHDTLEPEGTDKFKAARRSSMEMGTTEYQSERLDALNNPLVRLGWETLMEQNPDALMARIHEVLIPELAGDIPPKILKRLKSYKEFKKFKSPQDLLNAIGGGFLRRKGYGLSSYQKQPSTNAALQWERAASLKNPNYWDDDQVYIRSRPQAGKKTGSFDTFVHELAHAGSFHLKEAFQKSGPTRKYWIDYEDTIAGKHGVDPYAIEGIVPRYTGPKGTAITTYNPLPGVSTKLKVSPRHFMDAEEQLAQRSAAIAKKERGDEPNLYEKYATSPRGFSDESFRWMIEHADRELQRLQKNRLGRVPAASRKLSKEWKSKHTPLGHLPTEHDATIAQEEFNKERIYNRERASLSKNPGAGKRVQKMIQEAQDYAGATPQERKKLDEAEKQQFQFDPKNIIYPNVINLPQKRRGGTVKKRYAKGGGIRKPKGF